MKAKLLITAAVVMFATSNFTMTAQAGVVGPAPAMQSTAQSLDLIQKARRVCRQVMRCPRFLQCHWEKQCYITADYPPEHNGRR
jgi:hypothetical protein